LQSYCVYMCLLNVINMWELLLLTFIYIIFNKYIFYVDLRVLRIFKAGIYMQVLFTFWLFFYSANNPSGC
jgi:hypothetical protein